MHEDAARTSFSDGGCDRFEPVSIPCGPRGLKSAARNRKDLPARRSVVRMVPPHRLVLGVLIVLFCGQVGAWADEAPAKKPREMVHEGNRKLLAGKPAEALDLYKKAEKLKPDAREIAFAEGLAQYELGAYDEARTAFQEAIGLKDDALADDAVYSLGTCDHAEALSKMDTDPQGGLGLLESAMQRYQEVLANRPDHAAARDANLKAARLWHRLKQKLQQQQQQPQNSDKNKDEQQKDQDKNQQQKSEQDQQDKKQPKDEDQKQSSDQQQKDQREAEDQKDQQKQQDQQQESKEKQQARQTQPDKQHESRQQARRRLREMMQNLRQRQKHRRQPMPPAPLRPIDKDW